jgi:hypothetical protein
LIFAYAVHYTQGLGARMTAKLLRQHHIQLWHASLVRLYMQGHPSQICKCLMFTIQNATRC